MEKEIIYTKKATAPTAPYSQAVKAGNTVYIAGVCGDDAKTGEIMGNGDMRIETKYAMENLKATVEAAGGTMDDLVKVNVYITDIDKMKCFNEVYPQYFSKGCLPARVAMQVVKLAGCAELEIDAVAVI